MSKKKGGAGGAAGAGGDMHAETPVPPNDEDEKILYDAANYVFQHLQALVSTNNITSYRFSVGCLLSIHNLYL